jgi:membrane protein YqaA with SNARE-associated domain
MTEKSPGKGRYIALGLTGALIAISIAGSVLLVKHWEYMMQLERQGYLGLFVISIFAGSPLPIPTPSMILTFTLGSVLNPVLVGLVSGFGNGIGNALIFWTGRGGHAVFRSVFVSEPARGNSPSRIGRFFGKIGISRTPDFVRRRAFFAVFLLSIYPNPVLTPLILGMGAMRYSFGRFFLAIWAGKTVQSLLLSYLGYFGLRSLLRFLGVFHVP